MNLSKTFKAIRTLPLEVSYQQVESWIQQSASQNKSPLKSSWWQVFKWPWSN